MLKKNIGIVEDQTLVAELLKDYLETLNFDCCGVANNLTKARKLVEDQQPDAMLLDIDLNGVESGLDLAPLLHQKGIPFIVLSDLQDANTFKTVMEGRPAHYLEKPVSLITLRNALFSALPAAAKPAKLDGGNMLQVKDKQDFTLLIPISDIVYVHSDQGGCEVHYWDNNESRLNRKVELGTLIGLHQKMDPESIWQVHRSYLVNKKFITSFSPSGLRLKHTNALIPIGKTYRQQIMNWCQNL
ncbi:response regulator transcription factor [bacterium SCSIO 12741]|nr:response regulator transcription factor [bacterium SCSIO 12741]